MKPILLLLCLLPISTIVNGQFMKFNSNIWYFGGNAGLNFNSGYPVALSNGAINTIEGCATICDSTGTILFYTDGTKIYNRLHQIMPNGSGLLGHVSATQSSIIVPHPGNSNQFYVFTVDAVDNHLANGLRYSLVDMTLDNGKGNVVSTEKNILLHAPAGEKVTAILAWPESEYWVISHEWGSNNFLSYKVSATGVNTTPVISSCGAILSGGAYPSYPPLDGWLNALGYMKANKQGNKIAMVQHRKALEIFDFNRSTGEVSNCVTASSIYDQSYGVELSPNGSKLYLSCISGNLGVTKKIYQFDLTLANPLASATLIATTTNDPSAIQIGPDGKVYVSEWNYQGGNNNYLGRIDNPDLAYPGCTYVSNAVNLGSGIAKRGLPNLFYYRGFEFIDPVYAENNKLPAIIVFPNPATEYIQLINPTSTTLHFSLVNINGQIMDNWNVNANESYYHYTFDYTPGMYILNATNNQINISTQLHIIKANR